MNTPLNTPFSRLTWQYMIYMEDLDPEICSTFDCWHRDKWRYKAGDHSLGMHTRNSLSHSDNTGKVRQYLHLTLKRAVLKVAYFCRNKVHLMTIIFSSLKFSVVVLFPLLLHTIYYLFWWGTWILFRSWSYSVFGSCPFLLAWFRVRCS